VSKDYNFGLVYIKTLGKYYHLAVWAQGQVKVERLPLMTSLTKNPQPPTQNFFSLQTTVKLV